MPSTILEEISAAIAAIGGGSTFAIEESALRVDLELRVQGVGRVRLPITDATAEKLIAAARPAPFGVREQTRYDESVRSSWEIPADRITVGAAFERTLAARLDTIRRRLGLPPEGVFQPVLDKLLVYGPGQFFAPHQDSERADGMLASLVAVLPSRHAGGALVVTHNGKRRVFAADGGDDCVDLVAFYSDCRHEVERVKSGHRVALTYHLVHHDQAGKSAHRSTRRANAADRLTESVRAHFNTPKRPLVGSDGGETPDRLVYLLDHEYTSRGLGFARLKGQDRRRVAALLGVAERLGCETYLALAEVREVWNCEDDWDGYRGYRSHRGFESPKRNTDDYNLLELCDSEVTLGHWVGRDGASEPGVAAYVPDDEICSTRPSAELKPFRSEHEGYMGNYGNTVDRWYHRAALVVWPESRAFIVRAKGSPAWAIAEILRLVAAGKKDDAEKSARSLLPFWRHRATDVQEARFIRDAFRVAAALADADLARSLLAPLGATSLTATALPAVLAAASRFGLAWSKALFASWVQEHDSRATWLAALPLLCRALRESSWPEACSLGRFLLERELTTYEDRCTREKGALTTRYGAQTRKALVRDTISLIETAAALEDRQGRDRLVRVLTGPEAALPAVLLFEVLDGYRKKGPGHKSELSGLRPLHDHTIRTLRASLERPLRAADDWSLASAIDCTCPLCKKLLTFLRDRHARELAWPLAKDGRQHLHGIIDRFDLPVTHDTIRRGSPYTLMLEKQAILFSREAAERKRETNMLAALNRSRTSLGGSARRQ
jgi:hypothetical protein